MATYPMRFGRFPRCFGKSKARLKGKECKSRLYVPIMYCYKCEANTKKRTFEIVEKREFGEKGAGKDCPIIHLKAFLFYFKYALCMYIVYEAEG